MGLKLGLWVEPEMVNQERLSYSGAHVSFLAGSCTDMLKHQHLHVLHEVLALLLLAFSLSFCTLLL